MKIRITLTTKPGQLAIGETITLTKEPTNAFDSEAIRVTAPSMAGHAYVAAYYRIRKPGTWSAGRLLDKIPEIVSAVVVADQVAEVELPAQPEKPAEADLEADADMGRIEHDERGDN